VGEHQADDVLLGLDRSLLKVLRDVLAKLIRVGAVPASRERGLQHILPFIPFLCDCRLGLRFGRPTCGRLLHACRPITPTAMATTTTHANTIRMPFFFNR